jgi:phage-related protein
MLTLPSNLKTQKNLISQVDPWLILLDITLPDSTILRFVRNTEDVTFQGNSYTAFPFELEAQKMANKGELPSIQLRVSNVTRFIQYYLEINNGGLGGTVVVTLINNAYLLEDYSMLQTTYTIISASSDVNWATWSLGAPNPLRRQFPLYRYLPKTCSWPFKGVECKYATPGSVDTWSANTSYTRGDLVKPDPATGRFYACYNSAGVSGPNQPTWLVVDGSKTTDNTVVWVETTVCNKDFSSCKALNNTANFGGFIGLGIGGVRVV